MKITSVKPYMFFPGYGRNILLCKVETDEGLYGWGEAYVVQGKEKACEVFIKGMEDYLIGRDPFNIRHTGQVMFEDYSIRRGSPDFYAAWSAIEIALWDILGKACGQPVYNLLGGKSREKVRVYANGWWVGFKSPEDLAEKALKVKEQGYTAMKFPPFKGRWRTYITKQQEDFAVESVKAVREAVGPDVDLCIELNRRLSPYHAAHFSQRIMEFNPYWIEEPCLANNINNVVEAKKGIDAPVVTGETLFTKEDFVDVFEKRAADIINPDICACNGILGILELATMAAPYNILVSPHNYNSASIGLAATCHVSVVIPNFNITELFLPMIEPSNAITINPLKIKNGFVELSTEPGLGIDIDIKELLKHPYREFERSVPFTGAAQYYEEFPREEDFIF